ncbi:UNVERIFIED_CONTAM: hypothetical protein Sangu_2011100 [Sesamum angustifolium]|uniref:Uncharacterized protein n=1 Tax=Sesamum angustifolium TaxID=2727405 RepID=A0AAW2LJG5_9LAMI
MEASLPPAATNAGHVITGRPKEMLPNKEAKIEAMGMKKTSFAELFSTNRKLTNENKLTKLVVEDETLTLESNDLIDVAPNWVIASSVTLPANFRG